MSRPALLALLVACLPAAASADPVFLHVYATERGDGTSDAWIEDDARLVHELNRVPGRLLFRSESPALLAGLLKKLMERGTTVRRLLIEAHGAPGWTATLDEASLPLFAGLEGAFAPGAEIVFHSCQVAEGTDGARFLKRLGQTLLSGGGGSVTAPLWVYVAVAGAPRLFMGPLGRVEGASPAGWLRVDVAPGGAVQARTLGVGIQEAGELASTAVEQGRAVADRVEGAGRRAAEVLGRYAGVAATETGRLFDGF